MPRKYTTKGTKDREVEATLKTLRQEKGDATGRLRQASAPDGPEFNYVPAPTSYWDWDDFKPSFQRLREWLAASDDPAVCSALLQVWLSQHDVGWPEGVFVLDLDSDGSGRKPTKSHLLGWDAWRLHHVKGLGYQEIARQLTPDKWKKDRRTAGNAIRDFIATYLKKKPTHLERISQSIGNEMLGIDHDEEPLWAEARAIERENVIPPDDKE